jgi:hypothetical protein
MPRLQAVSAQQLDALLLLDQLVAGDAGRSGQDEAV